MKTSKLKLFAACLIALITTTARATDYFKTLSSKSTQTTVELTAIINHGWESYGEYGFEYCIYGDGFNEHWGGVKVVQIPVTPENETIKTTITNLAPGYRLYYRAYRKQKNLSTVYYYNFHSKHEKFQNSYWNYTMTDYVTVSPKTKELTSNSVSIVLNLQKEGDADRSFINYAIAENKEDLKNASNTFYSCKDTFTINNLNQDTKYYILFISYTNNLQKYPLKIKDGQYTYDYFEFSTKPLVSPSFANVTQTKATMKVIADAKVTGLKYRLNDGEFKEYSEIVDFKNLKPDTRYKVSFQGYVNDSLYNWPKDPEDKNYIFRTDDISVSAKASEVYQTSALIKFSYDYGDATYVSSGVEYCKKDYYSWKKEITSEKGEVRLTYLNPDDDYEWWAFLETKEGGKKYRKGKFKTLPLTCKTLPASCISNRSATLNGTISCDSYSSPEFGFEWKQMEGWHSDPAFTKGVKAEDGSIAVALVNGMLLPNTDYEYRTVVRFNGETCYQSDWKNFRTQIEYKYYPPSVYTLFRTDRENNRLVLCGYYVAGSENVATQGYEYWNTASSAPVKRVYTGTNGVFQITTDESMQYDLDLSTLADGNYAVRAFVTISSGGTTYGETLSFGVNSGSASGINSTETKEVTFSTSNQTLTIKDATNMSCSVYNLHGQIVDCRQHMTEYEQFHLTAGIVYIVKLSNGKTFKVLI